LDSLVNTQKPKFFLKTKILPPRAVPDVLVRPRLVQKLRENIDAPVTFIIAEAGCGKTTLTADFVRAQQRRVVWYQLDRTDADPFVFLTYICLGIKRFAPHFGEMLLAYLNEATEELLRVPDRAVDLLLNEILESLEQPFILVLDDYHHLGTETIVHRFVDRLLAYASEMMHIIITTRDVPPLAVMRRKAQSAALIINRDDLLFSDAEVRELFRTTLNIELKEEELAAYRARTQGWITALQLVRQITERQIAVSAEVNFPEMLRQSEKDIFNYFAEEVLERESSDTRELLMRLSLLESLPLDVCSNVFPESRCALFLPALVKRNVFLTVTGSRSEGEEYRLHPLFRDFLARRFRSERGLEEMRGEQSRIAEFFIAREQWEKAMPFLINAERFERAAEVIAENGKKWLANHTVTRLGSIADEIPFKVREKFPRSLLYQAEVARLQGETENSAVLLNRAAALLAKENDNDGLAEALHSLASLARRKGDYDGTFKFLERAENSTEGDSEIKMKCENTRGLCLVAQGDWTSAERHFRLALELAEKFENESYIRLISHNLALPFGFRGDFGESLRWFRRIFRSGSQLPQEAIGHLNVARMHLYRGEFADTEKHLELSSNLCQLYNLKFLWGEIFETYGNFYRDKGEAERAAEYYERARKSYEAADVDPAQKELDEERALLAFSRGDFASAGRLLKTLVSARAKSGNLVGLHTARLHLARVDLALGAAEPAVVDLEDLLAYFRNQNLFYYEALTETSMAEACFRLSRRIEMIAHLTRALDLSARFDYEHWLRGEIRRVPDFFLDEEILEKLPLDLRPVVSAPVEGENPIAFGDVPGEKARRRPDEPVVDLTLNLLGHPEIFRDSARPFAPDAWTTRRARDIFCFIASSKYRRVDKDKLIDAFWSETDFDSVEKNFHPTISHIRKALNSRQPFKQNFIVYRDGAYHLNPAFAYFIDTEEFSNLIAEAEKAHRAGDTNLLKEKSEAARRLYRGEFMAGVTDDWVEEPRRFYREQRGRILKMLARLSFKEKKYEQTIKYAHELLESDPYREDVHVLLMRVYSAQGKRGAVRDQFEVLERTLKQELGVRPAEETRRIYRELSR
jgi:LuxR family transcriptional regulator, maltose regulon positive regulatory protein